MKKLSKRSLAAGLSLALLAGLALSPAPAHATTYGYLGTPETSSSPINSNSFEATVTNATTGTGTNVYITPQSGFGNTFVNPGPGYSAVTISNTNAVPAADLSYSVSGLDLQYVTSEGGSWSQKGATSSGGTYVSAVYSIGSKATMSGAVPGELVFTYQFDVTSLAPSYTNGVNSINLALLNDPNGTAWALGNQAMLGDGAISDPSALPNYPALNNCSNCTTASLGSIYGSTYLDTGNGSVNEIQYTDNLAIGDNQISPVFFVATNAFGFTQGSMALGAGGTGGDFNVFVPDTPEPGTLVLFGSALGLVAFMMARRRQGQGIA